MNDQDRREFTEVMQALAASFNREPSKAFFAGYWIGLADLSLQALKSAASAALANSRFMPTPSELRELAGEVRAEDRAVIAWGALDKAVQKHGYYRTVQFDDPILNAAVHDLGGWEKVCDTPEREWFSFFRQRFIQTYQALARRGVISYEQSRPLIGYYDRTNSVDGYAPQDVRRIETGLPAAPVRIGPPQNPLLNFRPPAIEGEKTSDQVIDEIAKLELQHASDERRTGEA